MTHLKVLLTAENILILVLETLLRIIGVGLIVLVLRFQVLYLLDNVVLLDLLILCYVDDFLILIIWEGYRLNPLIQSLAEDLNIVQVFSSNNGSQP